MKIILKTLVAVFFCALFVEEASACSCSWQRPNLRDSFNKSLIIFSGKVEEVTPFFFSRKSRKMVAFTPDIHSELEPLYYEIKFKPKKYWKGEPYKLIIVETDARDENCGYAFEEGETYLVYVHELHNENINDEGIPAVWACSRTKEIKSSYMDVVNLNRFKTPYNPSIEVRESSGH